MNNVRADFADIGDNGENAVQEFGFHNYFVVLFNCRTFAVASI